MPPLALTLSGLLACLVRGAAGVPLRQTPVQPPSSQEPHRRCNTEASEPDGQRFLVDNSRLNAKTRGLSFRLSKNIDNKDLQAVALWGTEVIGVDHGDGWVEVGDCFLPTTLTDVLILRSLAPDGAKPEGSETSDLKPQEPDDSKPVDAETSGPKPQMSTDTVGPVDQAELKQALTEASKVVESLTKRLQKQKAELAEMSRVKTEMSQIKKALEKTQKDNEALQQEMQEQMSACGKSGVPLAQLKAVRQQNGELQSRVDKLEEEKKALNATIEQRDLRIKEITDIKEVWNATKFAQMHLYDEQQALWKAIRDEKAKCMDKVGEKTEALQNQVASLKAECEAKKDEAVDFARQKHEAETAKLKKKLDDQPYLDRLLENSEEEADMQEVDRSIVELKNTIDDLNKTKRVLEAKLQSSESSAEDLRKEIKERSQWNSRLRSQVDLLQGLSSENVGQRIMEMEAQLEKAKADKEATVLELVKQAQKKSLNHTRIYTLMANEIDRLQGQISLLKHNATVYADSAGASSNGESSSASSSSVASESSSASESSEASAKSGEAKVADITGDFVEDMLLSKPSSTEEQTSDVAELQARLRTSEKQRVELEKQVDAVKTMSDTYLQMAGSQVKDIQKNLFKNNHTFQLRFEACEKRNQELAEDCEAEKQELTDQLEMLRGGELGASSEAGNATNATVNVQPLKDEAMNSESSLALQATNQNLTERVARLNKDKAAAQAVADQFKVKFERKESDQYKTSELVDNLQGKLTVAQDRITVLEQQLAKASSSDAAAPAVGLGVTAALLLSAVAAA